MKPSPLQLKQSLIGEITITPSSVEKPDGDSVSVTVNPLFSRANENPNLWMVKQRVIFKAPEGRTIPYEGHIDVSGVFAVLPDLPEDKHLKLVAVTCPSLLYATAREAIAYLTARGPHGVFILPSVSFVDLSIDEQPPAQAPSHPARR